MNRVMRLAPQAKVGSFVMLTLGGNGRPQVRGDGMASVIVTGQVVDKDGNVIGGLYETGLKAVAAWESLLGQYGVTLPRGGFKTSVTPCG